MLAAPDGSAAEMAMVVASEPAMEEATFVATTAKGGAGHTVDIRWCYGCKRGLPPTSFKSGKAGKQWRADKDKGEKRRCMSCQQEVVADDVSAVKMAAAAEVERLKALLEEANQARAEATAATEAAAAKASQLETALTSAREEAEKARPEAEKARTETLAAAAADSRHALP